MTESPEPEFNKERRKSKSEKKSPSSDDKKKEKVKGGHQVYVPPLRRGSEDFGQGATEKPAVEKPVKSILKKPKEDGERKKTEDKKAQREHKEITSFVASKLELHS